MLLIWAVGIKLLIFLIWVVGIKAVSPISLQAFQLVNWIRAANHEWDCLHLLGIQFLELSLVLGCILFIKLEGGTNQGHELNWVHAWVLVRDPAHLVERPALWLVSA